MQGPDRERPRSGPVLPVRPGPRPRPRQSQVQRIQVVAPTGLEVRAIGKLGKRPRVLPDRVQARGVELARPRSPGREVRMILIARRVESRLVGLVRWFGLSMCRVSVFRWLPVVS